MDKLIITVAPTGEGAGKKDNPALPVTPAEIAEAVYDSWLAGAAVAHIHVRDDAGNPTMSTEKFSETVGMIRRKCDIVLNLTSSGDINAADDIRMAHLPLLKPDIASLDCGSMNWAYNELFINHPHFLEKLSIVMRDNGIMPEVEIFDTGMLDNAMHLVKKGLFTQPLHVQFVMGAAGGIPASIENLIYLIRQLPTGATWSAFGIGRHHIPIMAASMLLGGHVRVGFEDNIYYKKGVLASSNAQLVERAIRLAREFGRDVASAAEARAYFGLPRSLSHII
ncbi:MAG: 3-keto-5-aminohexanoate cleavage protein [Oscillospiraceae bacterium]|jgi:uncharacterized protein (DUF849 family)|nr:3-keto-5-aminohexanoate cleavage protein [Oscillospiraceae bacterium]